MRRLTWLILIAYFLICGAALLTLLVMVFIGSLLFWAVLIDVIHKIPWGARESTPVERV